MEDYMSGLGTPGPSKKYEVGVRGDGGRNEDSGPV